MAALMPLGKQQYFAASGAPLVGGKVYTYAAGTTSLLSTYSDKAGVTPNTNPVLLDSRGEATIFWGNAGYKVVLKDSADVTIWTQDNLYAVQDSSSMTFAQELITATAGQTVFNLSISYTNGTNSLAVFCNGLRLNSTDYTETSTTSVTLNTGATVGDEFLFVAGDFAASTTGADLVTYTPAGTGAVATTVQAKLRESVSVKDFGAVGDGVADDTAAVQAAINASTDKTLVVSGTPLLSSKITISNRIRIQFQGAAGLAGGGQLPSSYFIKKSTMASSCIDITAAGVIIDGGGVVCQAGNTDNGITILANNVTLYKTMVYGAGQDGIRIGADVAGYNTNTVYLDSVTSSFNTRHGIYIHDASTNANACVLTLPFTQSNGGDGIKLDIAHVNTIIGPLTELNTGIGLHFASGAVNNQVFGGDIFEANVAGNLNLDAGSTGNMIYGQPRYASGGIQNAGTRNVIEGYESPAFTPGITFGGGSTGVTYSLATGHYTIIGNSIVVYVTLILSNKGSSSGAVQITGLPFPMNGITFNSGVSFSQYTGMSGLTGALVGQVSNATSVIGLYQSSATGTVAITEANFTNTSNIQFTAVYPF